MVSSRGADRRRIAAGVILGQSCIQYHSLMALLKSCGYSQVEHHVYVTSLAISAGISSKKHDFVLGPTLISRQSGECSGLETGFSLDLVPDANFLLYEEVSTGLCHKITVWRQRGETDEMAILWSNAGRG